VEALRQRHPDRPVVLVSKDINMRVKARALGLEAEDYQNDKTLEDGDLLYTGMLQLPLDFWAKVGKKVESWQSGASTCYRISGAITQQLHINQFVYYEAPGENSLFARVIEIRDKTAVLETLKDYGHQKNNVWGVTTRNREQNFAMNLLMDPDVDFVTLAGTAGTGKTLMALAAGLNQVLDERRYTEIIMTRATVSVGEDIGFLPGTEEEKMGPWMGALDDNLEFLAKGDGGNPGEWGRSATNDLIRSRIKIKSMNFMRGRTFLNKYVIIDEAQNLTPKQMKTLITRAGPGTKIICMGNLAQIDTPYLTEGSSGLTYVVDRLNAGAADLVQAARRSDGLRIELAVQDHRQLVLFSPAAHGSQRRCKVLGPLDQGRIAAKGLGIGDKVGVAQLGRADPVRIVALLVHADGAVHAVVDQQHDDGQLVLHGGCKLLAMHQKVAIAGNADDTALLVQPFGAHSGR